MDSAGRIVALEQRLARVERVLGLFESREPVDPTPPLAPPEPPLLSPEIAPVAPPQERAPIPSAVPPPLPLPAPSVRQRTESPPQRKRDLEGVVGIAVLGRVGIGSLLLAAAYFAQ